MVLKDRLWYSNPHGFTGPSLAPCYLSVELLLDVSDLQNGLKVQLTLK